MIRILASAALTACLAVPASADPWKDESGKGRERGGHDRGYGGGWDAPRGGYARGYGGGWDAPRRDRKIKYRTAEGCEVERKWKKGEYEHKVKCKDGGDRYGYR